MTSVRRRLVLAVPVALVAGWLVAALMAPPKRAPQRAQSSAVPAHTFHARAATLKGAFAQANPGDRIVLAAGDYGTFYGGMKTGRVLIEAAADAHVTMAVQFDPAANITLQGIDIKGLEIAGRRSHDLTIRDSRFDRAQAVIHTGDLADANVTLDHDVFDGFVKCASCYEGRVDLVGRTRHQSGVTIRDSHFRGGNSDGIQNGGNGVRILDNAFDGILQHDGPDGVHADAIQLVGSRGTVIRGNRMHNVATGVMAPDGSEHELIEKNLIETAGYPYAITLGGDRGSVVRGNRLPGGSCRYGLPCGTLRIGAGKDGVGSSGTVVVGNVLGALAVDGASRLAVERGNRVAG